MLVGDGMGRALAKLINLQNKKKTKPAPKPVKPVKKAPRRPKKPTITKKPLSPKEAANRQCSSWWKLADSYAAAGLSDKSKVYLKKIVDKHPDTDWSAKATKRLEDMPTAKDR
ncbi:MAG: hypothetical protein HN350_00410 [Phycisphaerales bacterium]|jgi:hypothetical protein|nr:hypothetical protein [Phycisphaerales bacterium]